MNSVKTLSYNQHDLSDPNFQRDVLNNACNGSIRRFEEEITAIGLHPLKPTGLDILQVNLGKMCNQTCRHCHVDAGPDRKEIMTEDTMEACLEALRPGKFHTLDLTGGAPELNPGFREFVIAARPLVDTLIVRSNLTIIVSNKKYHDLPHFFKDQRVDVVSSLPFYSKSRTDAQRGEGVFDASVRALKMLNDVGYGQPDSGLVLNLVYNPTGSFLPGDQHTLQSEYKRRLSSGHGISFNELYTITNMPISRFLEYLVRTDNLEAYMERLVDAFNPQAVSGVMCRNTLSVGWDGYLYDCDFNQMLEMRSHGHDHIKDLDTNALLNRSIRVDQHCFGCTAGSGSSCGGATT